MSDTPTWLHRKAPTNLKTYDAWSSDPTRYHLDTALDDERVPGICWPCWAVACIAAGGIGVWCWRFF